MTDKQVTVWMLMKDPGGMNGAVRVYRELATRGLTSLKVFAIGYAAKNLGAQDIQFESCDDASALLQRPLPDLVVTTMDSEGAIGYEFIKLLSEKGIMIPTIAMSDHWQSRALGTWGGVRPSFITVNDEFGANLVQKAWPNMDRQRIIPTGFPIFDEYAGLAEQVPSIRQRVREDMDIEDKVFMPLFLGDLEGTAKLFSDFLDAVERSRRLDSTILLRRHPRMRDEADEAADEYEQLEQICQSSEIRIKYYEYPNPVQGALAASDVVVGHYSTAIAEAAAMRLPAINLQFTPTDEPFIMSALGCCAEAKGINELTDLLTLASTGTLADTLIETQTKVFRLDGKNASRVADLVADLIEQQIST